MKPNNKLKIYIRTKYNLEIQAKIYENVFKGKILKHSKDNNLEWNFAYINIANDLNILLARYQDTMPKFGYSVDFVISLNDEKLFLELYHNLENHSSFKKIYGVQEYEWGIKITKFMDEFNYGWILETKS